MLRYLFDTVRKHLPVKFGLGLILVMAAGTGIDLAYRFAVSYPAWDAAEERQARQITAVLGEAVAKPLYEENQAAVRSALQVLGADHRVLSTRVTDRGGRAVATTGTDVARHDEKVTVVSRGVDYVDDFGNKRSVGTVVLTFARESAVSRWNGVGGTPLTLPAALALLMAASVFVLARRIAPPLQDIEIALGKLAKGETDIRLSGLGRPDEIGRLSSATLFLRNALLCCQQTHAEMRAALAEKIEQLNLAPVGILVERDGVIATCNSRIADIFGRTAGELVGSPCRTLYADDASFVRVEEELQQARQRGVAYSGEARLMRGNGETFWGGLSCLASPTLNECNVWACDDIGRTKQAEEDTVERRIRLEKLVAERTRQLEEARQAAARVSASTSLTGSGSAGDIADIVPFDPASAVAGVAALFATRAEELGVELVLDIETTLPPLILGNPFRISQVLSDLLSRGIRSAKQGEIILTLRETARDQKMVQLQFCVGNSRIDVAVEQKAEQSGGDGLAAEAPNGQSGGTRLGLAITRRMAELMGARLTIDSKRDSGTAFQLAAEFEMVQQGNAKACVYAELLRSYAGRRVMVIDDSLSARVATAALLSGLGFVPTLFESGGVALASLAQPGAPKYAFICIDRGMPGLDGLQVARRLQAHFGAACPPLLLMVAGSHVAGVQAAADGFAAVLSKPVTIDRLFAPIASTLGVSSGNSMEARGARLKNKRVLLVCSAGAYEEVTADVLHEAGAVVRVAGDGIEALQSVREKTPDCVLMDCRLAAMAAYELAGKLRALGYASLPIVGMSAGGVQADRASCLAAGMNDCIANPGDLPQLANTLANWIARPPMASTSVGSSEVLPPLPPELDVAAGLRHLRGKTALFLKALRMFRDNCGQQFQLEFRSAVKAGDWLTSRRLAQSLKDMAATIGAKHVSAAAARLETAIRTCNYTEANTLLAEVTEKLRILVQGLAHIG